MFWMKILVGLSHSASQIIVKFIVKGQHAFS